MGSKRQKASVIISAILGLIIYVNFWFGGSQSIYDQSAINLPLSFGILICFIVGYKIPTQITLNVFDYWFVIFPLAFVLLLYGIIFVYEQIMINAHAVDFEPIDKFFKIGLGIAVMTSLGAIMVQINADRRLRNIEKSILNEIKSNELSDSVKEEIRKIVEQELNKQRKN